ncbi:hypothetical protein C2845_PM03G21230 [Panicum miliaceum]|uniref:Uncharacterized protein n=1 Tax=Panicum miliaceum TaxID=4540 RepID=A0A3L6T8L8_PANMI|nr:hypothetical protein C2845_PM03G21230 [Panicum miliaceum]
MIPSMRVLQLCSTCVLRSPMPRAPCACLHRPPRRPLLAQATPAAVQAAQQLPTCLSPRSAAPTCLSPACMPPPSREAAAPGPRPQLAGVTRPAIRLVPHAP